MNKIPSIISNVNELSGIRVGSQMDILWPFHAYEICLPATKNKPLNIFEETILKLIGNGINDITELHEEACMDKEIIEFIIHKLTDHGLLDNRNQITDHGKELIGQWDKEHTENNFVTATVFIDLVGGLLMPVIEHQPLRFQKKISVKGHNIIFEVGRSGKEKPIYANQVYPHTNLFNIKPTTSDIVNIIKIHRKNHNKFCNLKKSTQYLPNYYSDGGAITIDEDPIRYLYHSKVIIQEGSVDFIISDPFGYGFSSIMQKSYSKYIEANEYAEHKLTELKEKALTIRLGKRDSNARMSNLNMFSDSLKDYKELYNHIYASEVNWKNAKKSPTSSNEEKDQLMYFGFIIKDLYAAIEWTLRELVFKYPSEHFVSILESQNYMDNNTLLIKMANKIGFNIQTNSKLLEVQPSKIKSIATIGPDMVPFLTLSIASASNDSTHPLYDLSKKNSNWLEFIYELKRSRDAESHGDFKYINSPKEKNNSSLLKKITYFKDQTYNSIKILLPILRPSATGENMPNDSVQEGSNNDDRLIADINLNNFFGYNEFLLMPSELKELFMRTELSMHSVDDKTESEIECKNVIVLLSSILEFCLMKLININRSKNNDIIIDKDNALDKVIIYFYLPDSELPETISTISQMRIERASKGMSQSLGAHLIALILIADTTFLKKLKSVVPDLVITIDTLLIHRRHGSELIFMQLQELVEIKDKVYDTTRILLEASNE